MLRTYYRKQVNRGQLINNLLNIFIDGLSLKINLTFDLVRFQVLTATSMKMAVLWDVAPCSLVEIDQRFRGDSCLHHQGYRSATSQKTAIFEHST
jgi:hypothetical protein